MPQLDFDLSWRLVTILRPHMDSRHPLCDEVAPVAKEIIKIVTALGADDLVVERLIRNCEDAGSHHELSFLGWAKLTTAIVDDFTFVMRREGFPEPGGACLDGRLIVGFLNISNGSSDIVISAAQGLYRWLDQCPASFLEANAAIEAGLREKCRTVFWRENPQGGIDWFLIAIQMAQGLDELLIKRGC